jgi:hypothetical protein
MKKILITALILSIISVGSVNAEEKQNTEAWTPTVEAAVGVHNAYVDEYSGSYLYRNTVGTQSLMLGIEKSGTGFYVQVDNFTPFKGEILETDFYAGFYIEIHGVKIDSGYSRYWVRETGETDFNGVYTEITLPALGWELNPFVKAEYRFAEKVEQEDGHKISLDGFLYLFGLKREFQIHDKVQLMAEVSLGGNTGIYGMSAENLSFAREKVEMKISLLEKLNLKLAAMTQQNLGKDKGIATDTDKVFVMAGIEFTI